MIPRAVLETCFASAIDAVRGDRVVERHLRVGIDSLGQPALVAERPGRRGVLSLPPAGGRLRIMALGKASVAMAGGAWQVLRAAGLDAQLQAGLLIIKDEPIECEPHHHESALDEFRQDPRWQITPGGHPVADARSLHAGSTLLDFVAGSQAEDRYLVLLSGGASALAVQPVPGLALAQKSRWVQTLMQRGAPIASINLLRRHLSRLKGGGLSRAMTPAQHLTLAISDVPADDPAVIGSGPTIEQAPDPEAVIRMLKEYALWQPWQSQLAPLLQAELRTRGGGLSCPPMCPAENIVVLAGAEDAREAAMAIGQRAGLGVQDLGRCHDGDLEPHARAFCQRVRAMAAEADSPLDRLLVASGEPTISLAGAGPGGRAQHFGLLCARELQGLAGVGVLVAGTDGSDGPTDATGACIDGDSWEAMLKAGADPARALREYASYPALRAIDALLRTGPTGTNVGDLFLAVIRRSGDTIAARST